VLDLAAASVKLAAHVWVCTDDYGQTRSELLEKVKMRFEEADINLEQPRAAGV
jgi:hypothetical protein